MRRLCWALVMASVLALFLGACTTNSEPTTEPSSTITEKEAIAIASDLRPPEAVARAGVVSILRQELGPHGTWQVEFLSANVTRDELGWQEDAKTKFVGSDEVLMNVIISIDARTGEILSRTAGTTFLLGGPIPSGTPREPITPSGLAGGSWQVGENFDYGQQSIWGDILVGLEPKYQDNKVVGQYLNVYNLTTREKRQVIELPDSRVADMASIYENKIVWASVDKDEYFRHAISSKIEPAPNYDVFLLDLDTSQVQQLTTEEHAQMSPRIYGDTVVWLDARNQPLNQYPPPFDVYALDLKTMKERRLTENATAEGYSQLSISGNVVVWTDIRHADVGITSHGSNDPKYNNEIYVYDLGTNQEHRITTSLGNDCGSDISGDRIVWLRQEDYQKADVFLYDLKSGLETQVSHGGYAAFNPSIYDDRIVWTDARATKGNTTNDVVMNGQTPGADIYLYELKTQKETQLTETEAWKVWCFPVIHGDYMVYRWSRMISPAVFAINLP